MSDAARPSGLTAMAVLNFVFGGFLLVQVPWMVLLLAMHEGAMPGRRSEENKPALELVEKAGKPVIATAAVLYGLAGIVQVLAGFGYLKLKRFLGRAMGNLYVLLAIALSLLWGIGTAGTRMGGFNLGLILNLVYPLITAVLINTTFREDLVN
jgi:hypothetical protein